MNIIKTLTLSLCALLIVFSLPSCYGRKKARAAKITLETDNQEALACKIAKF